MSEEAQEGRNAYVEKRKPDFSRVSAQALAVPSEVAHVKHRFPLPPHTRPTFGARAELGPNLADGGSRPHAARCDRSRPGGHGAGWLPERVSPAAFLCGAGRRGVHSGRHESLKRLLRRTTRRRHRRPAWAGQDHGGRPRPAPPGAARDIHLLRRGGGGGRLPGRGRRLGAPPGRRGFDPRRGALHGRAAPLWLRGPRRGLRVPLLRDRRGRGLVLRAGQTSRMGGVCPGRTSRVDGGGDPHGQQRSRHRDRLAGRQAHARGAAGPSSRARALRADHLRRLRAAVRDVGLWAR